MAVEQLLDVHLVLEIVVRLPVAPDHSAVEDFRRLHDHRQKAERALPVEEEVPRVVRGKVRREVCDARQALLAGLVLDRVPLEALAVVRLLPEAELREIDVGLERCELERLGVAGVADALCGLRVYADVEMLREVRVARRLSAHVEVVFDVALRVVDVRYDDALERERLSLARGRELAEYAGVALFGMLDLAARLHDVVYREDAAALARLSEFYLEPREEVARAERAQLVAVYRQHAVLDRGLFAEAHGTDVYIVYFKGFRHVSTPFGETPPRTPAQRQRRELSERHILLCGFIV